jgi:hypothetical protein
MSTRAEYLAAVEAVELAIAKAGGPDRVAFAPVSSHVVEEHQNWEGPVWVKVVRVGDGLVEVHCQRRDASEPPPAPPPIPGLALPETRARCAWWHDAFVILAVLAILAVVALLS